MAAMNKFSKEEQLELINLLTRVDNRRATLSDTYHMGYFVLGAATQLSNMFGREISRRDVVNEIMKLKVHLLNFLSFTKLVGVHYDEEENYVSVEDCYGKQNRETAQMRMWRTNGEPLYRDLRRIFIDLEADQADYRWLLRSFETSEGLSLYHTEEYPQKIRGIKELLARGKCGGGSGAGF